MPITEKQREARRKTIGASDIARICGLAPPAWGGAADVWAEKVHGTHDNETEAQWFGNVMESPLVNWACGELNLKAKKNQRRVHPAGLLSASYDALGDLAAIEAKAPGGVSHYAFRPEEWADGPPDYVQIQCQQQCLVASLDVVYVAAWLPNRGRSLFMVHADRTAQEALAEAANGFWDYVEKQQPPPPEWTPPTMDTLKRLRRTPGKVVTVDPRLVANEKTANSVLKKAQEAHKQARQELLAALGDAEAATWGEEGQQITYMEQKRNGYTVQPSTFRVFRYAKVRK